VNVLASFFRVLYLVKVKGCSEDKRIDPTIIPWVVVKAIVSLRRLFGGLRLH
jgi:hypothetical protein